MIRITTTPIEQDPNRPKATPSVAVEITRGNQPPKDKPRVIRLVTDKPDE